MFKPFATALVFSTLLIAPALAGSITFDTGSAHQPCRQTIVNETNLPAAAGGSFGFTRSGVDFAEVPSIGNVTNAPGAFGRPADAALGQGDAMTNDASKLAAANLSATLLGCHAPGCADSVAEYVTLDKTDKYFVLSAGAPDGAPDNFVLPQDRLNQSSVPEPATFALLGFGALGLLGLRRSRPNSAI